MSYKCEVCKQPQPVHTSPVRVVAGTRKAVYPVREYKNHLGEVIRLDNGGVGTEITGEIMCCPSCATKRGGVNE